MYSVQCTWYKSQLRLYGGATPYEGSRSSDSDLSRSEGLDHAERASTGFIFASGGVPSEGYGHGGSDVCLGDGHTARPREYRRKVDAATRFAYNHNIYQVVEKRITYQ